MTALRNRPRESATGLATPAVDIRGVAKSYPGVEALRPLDLTVREGERVAVVGPSGSGKTTLLRLVAGTERPDAGTIALAGRALRDLSPGRDLARLVGIIHQQLDLVPQLSVLQNVLAGRLGEWGLLRSLWSLIVPQETALADTALDRVGLRSHRLVRTAKLSGGEQQRVAIARLLVQNPRIILADEPVASLDPARAEDLIRLLTSIAAEEGKTLIASLHTVDLARRHFDRIVALRSGRVLFDRPAGAVTDADLDRLYALEEDAA